MATETRVARETWHSILITHSRQSKHIWDTCKEVRVYAAAVWGEENVSLSASEDSAQAGGPGGLHGGQALHCSKDTVSNQPK